MDEGQENEIHWDIDGIKKTNDQKEKYFAQKMGKSNKKFLYTFIPTNITHYSSFFTTI